MRKIVFAAPVLAGLMAATAAGAAGKNEAKALPVAGSDGFFAVFDGKTLDGWVYDPVYWRVENGCLVGEITPETIVKRNTFCYRKDLVLRDFEIKVKFRVSEGGNSGVSYRNTLIDSLPYAMAGYQADIDGRNVYTGQNYEERGRQFLALRGQTTLVDEDYRSPAHKAVREMGLDGDALSKLIRKGDWNQYHIIVRGNRLLHYINGVLMCEVTDQDVARRRMEGLLGVQVHVGPPMKIEYRDFLVKVL